MGRELYIPGGCPLTETYICHQDLHNSEFVKSHDQTYNIFKLSLKNGSEQYIAQSL